MPEPKRRKVIWGFQAIGLLVGGYLFYLLVEFPVTAVAATNIVYVSPHFYNLPVMGLYLVATCVSCFFAAVLSSIIYARFRFARGSLSRQPSEIT